MRRSFLVVLALVACRKDRAQANVVFDVTLERDDLVVRARDLPAGSTIAPDRIPIGAVLHELTIRQTIGADEIDFGQRITVTLPDGDPTTVPLPPVKLGKQLVARLASVTRGPVVFANEAPPPPQHTALLAEPADNIVFGPAKLAEDIDWIAVPAGTTLTIYERRTGKAVETKTFAAQPDHNVMKAWLAERVTEP